MAKDNKITVMPKTKNDFDKFSRTPGNPPVVEVAPEVLNQMPSVEEAAVLNSEVLPPLSETVKGTATFNRGGTMPDITPRTDADPLHVECLVLFRKLIAGGYVTPWALPELRQVDAMIAKLKDTVEVK